MPSPFPGMDPYIENPRVWSGFHNVLAPAILAQLNRQIRPRYFADVTPYTVYDSLVIGRSEIIYPDVSVAQRQPPTGALATAVLAPPAPVKSSVPLGEPLRLHRFEIRTLDNERLVTVIEILSPSNKRPGSRDHQRYQSKRLSLLYSDVHLVEIDLLRAGERPRLARPVPGAPYYVTVSRTEQRPQVDVWPIQLWERLPVVPTPLLHPDPDVTFDLQLAVAEAYERLGYQDRFNYQAPPPPPPLSEAEAAWVEQLLKDYRQRA